MNRIAIILATLALLASSAFATPSPKKPPASKVVTEAALLVQYQRVGRELMKLDESRGKEATQDLWPRFKTLKVEKLAPPARAAVVVVLDELSALIDRRKGVSVSQQCLNNPLAEGCQ